MSYLVLARKYRPRQFRELVGQQHIATTFLNAFKLNKIGQAYLFTGTRGTGKTTVARIFAKALRCEDPQSQIGGKNAGIPCDKCASCTSINNGSTMDVLEIDGASNNGVENVREIREQVKFMPSSGRMKVYIIDEVHMLSNQAFNALLKTLEEPPAHIAFVLATTEVQKLPATILSRCQRFDFKRVPEPLILEHLHKLVKLEGLEADSEALRLVAKKAEGSMRDALSALDQCIALSGKKLDIKSVSEALGVVSGAFLAQLLNFTFQRELVKAATQIQEAYQSGVEMKQLAISVAEALRNAMFVKLNADDGLADVSTEERKAFNELVKDLSPETIQAAYRSMSISLDEILRSPLPKASLEMALAKISSIGQLKSLDEILIQLQKGGGSQINASQAPAEKKNSEPAINSAPIPTITASQPFNTAPATPASPSTISFQGFVAYVLAEKASLGALLEHAIALTPDADWPAAQEIRVGFRKSHGFYLMQAQHKANLEQLQKSLHTYLHKSHVMLKLESVADGEKSASSMMESRAKNISDQSEEKKKAFLEHDIVKNTKEIFGADMASFDIDKTKQ